MVKNILLLIAICFNISVSAQSYLGTITKQVNLREGPGKEYAILKSLKPGANIFIISLNSENDFYNVIDINSDKEGYVSKSFINIGKEVKRNEEGLFNSTGEINSTESELEIFNNTYTTLTLKLNTETYSFSPRQKKKITIYPGTCEYRASAPGVTPNIGTESLQGGHGYSWEFYIVTHKR